MKIVNLIENTKGSTECGFEHGLSFYIETKNHKILMDTGASSLFLQNAKKLGIDLKQVDMVILSHGHYDHCGGVMDFVKINPNAKIYLKEDAVKGYFHVGKNEERYIGIDPSISALPQCIFVKENLKIDDGISLFTNIKRRRPLGTGNLVLKRKEEHGYVQDDFTHEQCLVLEENGKQFLFSGCAHNGILNILDEYKHLYGKDPDVVISGFHLMKKSEYSAKEIEEIKKIGQDLKEKDTLFYTGHCTGEAAYEILKETMGDRLHHIHSGDEIHSINCSI